MLRKCNRLLAVLLAVTFAITTFGSDFYNAKVWAADEETADQIQSEETNDGIAVAEWEQIPEEASDNSEDAFVEEQTEGASEEASAEGAVTEEGNTEEANTVETVENAETPVEAVLNTDMDITAAEETNVEEIEATDTTLEDESKKKESLLTEEEKAEKEAALLTAEEKEKAEKEAALLAEKEKAEKEKAETVFPAQTFEDSVSGMNVHVAADEGAFPEGTTMRLSAISDGEAMEAAEDALDGEVKQAKGVDITFVNSDGEEIEPAAPVQVSISLADALEGDSFSVVHKDDVGNAEKVADASNDGASFVADSFSVYIVAGSGDSQDDLDDQKAIATYNFYHEGAVFNTQKVKKGEELLNPGIPEVDSSLNQVFLGWYTKNSDGTYASEPVSFGTITNDVVAGSEYDVYSKIETTYYLTFIGLDEEIFYVKKVVVTGDDSTVVDISNIGFTEGKRYETKENKKFCGWAETKGVKVSLGVSDPRILSSVDVAKTSTVYAVDCDYVWINFDENTGSGFSGVTYTKPIQATLGESTTEPAAPTRLYYTFDGWYTEKENQTAATKFDWSTVIGSTELTKKDFTLYAKWVEAEDTEFTVIVYTQNLDCNGYDYYKTFSNVKGKTGQSVDDTLIADYLKLDTNAEHPQLQYFKYNNTKEVGTAASGNFVPYAAGQEKLSVKQDTVVRVYYDRQAFNIEFYAKVGDATPLYTLSGPYGTLVDPSDWPKEETVWYALNKKNGEDWSIDFIDRYILDRYENFADGMTLKLYKATYGKVSWITKHFLKEDLDGNYVEDRVIVKYAPIKNALFDVAIEDYYIGFKPYFYNTNGDPTDKSNLIVGDVVFTIQGDSTDTSHLYIYFKRETRSLTFMDNFSGNTKAMDVDDAYKEDYANILYEKPLNSGNFYKNNAPKKSALSGVESSRPGYELRTNGDDIIWYLDQNGQVEYQWDDTMPLYNKVLYTYWEPVTRTVTLDPNGGTLTVAPQVVVPYGEKLSRTEYNSTNESDRKVFRNKYEFVGWYNVDNTPYEFDNVVADTTIVAHWRNPGRISVIYDGNGHGTGVPVDNYKYSIDSSAVVGAPPQVVEKGYKFVGWFIENDTKGVVYYPDNCFDIIEDYIQGTGDDSKIVLKALYNKTTPSGIVGEATTITYHSNDERDLSLTVTAGAGPELLVNEAVKVLTLSEVKFEREGYTFKGWSKTAGPNNYPVFANPGEFIAADNDGIPNDLYAIWEKDTTPPDDPPSPPDDPPSPPDGPPSNPTPPTTPSTSSSTSTPTVADREAVLGERRGNDAAVLGARRSKTEDSTNDVARILLLIVAAFAATGLMTIGKKRKEEN